MSLPELRKVVTYDEDIHRDGARAADPVLRLIGVAAVVKNPWAGRGFVEDLSPEIKRMAPVLGKMLTDPSVAQQLKEMQNSPEFQQYMNAVRMTVLCIFVPSFVPSCIARIWFHMI